MSQQGKSGKALAIGMFASFTGTFFSAIIAAFCSEFVADVAFLMYRSVIRIGRLLPDRCSTAFRI